MSIPNEIISLSTDNQNVSVCFSNTIEDATPNADLITCPTVDSKQQSHVPTEVYVLLKMSQYVIK